MLSRSGVAASCHPSSTPIAIPRDPISAATPIDVQQRDRGHHDRPQAVLDDRRDPGVARLPANAKSKATATAYASRTSGIQNSEHAGHPGAEERHPRLARDDEVAEDTGAQVGRADGAAQDGGGDGSDEADHAHPFTRFVAPPGGPF